MGVLNSLFQVALHLPSLVIAYRGTSLIRNRSLDPTVGLCLGTYGDPRGVSVSYERGDPVACSPINFAPPREALP